MLHFNEAKKNFSESEPNTFSKAEINPTHTVSGEKGCHSVAVSDSGEPPKKKPSPAQIAANKENGKKGGPKTPEGKKKSSENAYVHGLLSKVIVGENAKENPEFLQMHAELWEELTPQGAQQIMLFDMLATHYWQLRLGLGHTISALQVWTMVPFQNLNRYMTSLYRESLRILAEFNALQSQEQEASAPPPLPKVESWFFDEDNKKAIRVTDAQLEALGLNEYHCLNPTL